MTYWVHLAVLVELYAALGLSLNLVYGIGGMTSFGHASFACIGGYTSALLALKMGVDPGLGSLAGAALAGLLGMLAALPALRLTGDYLALSTFGWGIMVHAVARNWMELTHGPAGLTSVVPFGVGRWVVESVWGYCALCGLWTAVVFGLLWRLKASPFGVQLAAVREDPAAAGTCGVNSRSRKIQAFVIGAAIAGLTGALQAHYLRFVEPNGYGPQESINLFLLVVLGGAGSLVGTVLAAGIVVLVPELLRLVGASSLVLAPLQQAVFGFALLYVVFRRPQGLLGQLTLR
jgi:branched-chain amino acid transport system permease protein